MTREQDIRAEILLQLYATRPLRRSAALLARQAVKAGLDFAAAEIVRECAFLVGQGLVAAETDPATGQRRYRIASAGILHYEAGRND